MPFGASRFRSPSWKEYVLLFRLWPRWPCNRFAELYHLVPSPEVCDCCASGVAELSFDNSGPRRSYQDLNLLHAQAVIAGISFDLSTGLDYKAALLLYLDSQCDWVIAALSVTTAAGRRLGWEP